MYTAAYFAKPHLTHLHVGNIPATLPQNAPKLYLQPCCPVYNVGETLAISPSELIKDKDMVVALIKAPEGDVSYISG